MKDLQYYIDIIVESNGKIILKEFFCYCRQESFNHINCKKNSNKYDKLNIN